MKKLISVIIVCCILLFVGCNGQIGSQPEKVSDGAYNAGKKALKIADNFLNMSISTEDAYKQLEDISNRMSEEKEYDSFVAFDIDNIKEYVDDFNDTYLSDDSTTKTRKLQVARNELASELNEEMKDYDNGEPEEVKLSELISNISDYDYKYVKTTLQVDEISDNRSITCGQGDMNVNYYCNDTSGFVEGDKVTVTAMCVDMSTSDEVWLYQTKQKPEILSTDESLYGIK